MTTTSLQNHAESSAAESSVGDTKASGNIPSITHSLTVGPNERFNVANATPARTQVPSETRLLREAVFHASAEKDSANYRLLAKEAPRPGPTNVSLSGDVAALSRPDVNLAKADNASASAQHTESYRETLTRKWNEIVQSPSDHIVATVAIGATALAIGVPLVCYGAGVVIGGGAAAAALESVGGLALAGGVTGAILGAGKAMYPQESSRYEGCRRPDGLRGLLGLECPKLDGTYSVRLNGRERPRGNSVIDRIVDFGR